MSNTEPSVAVINLKPGDKFIAGDYIKNPTYPPGTIGFVSYVNNNLGQHICSSLSVVIIKRGKTGKARVEQVSISVPTLKAKDINSPISKKIKDYFISAGLKVVSIERVPLDSKSIYAFTDMDFVGWALSRSQHLANVYSKYGAKLKIWPKKETNPLNLILNARHDAALLDQQPDKFFSIYSSIPYRIVFGETLRHLEAKLVKALIHREINEREYTKSCLKLISQGKSITDEDLRAQAKKLLLNNL